MHLHFDSANPECGLLHHGHLDEMVAGGKEADDVVVLGGWTGTALEHHALHNLPRRPH